MSGGHFCRPNPAREVQTSLTARSSAAYGGRAADRSVNAASGSPAARLRCHAPFEHRVDRARSFAVSTQPASIRPRRHRCLRSVNLSLLATCSRITATMTRQRPLLLLFIVFLGAGALAFGGNVPAAADQGAASGRPPGTNYKGPAFTFNKIQEGVYHAVGTGSLVVMSNADHHRGRPRRAGRRLARHAGRRLGAARRAQGHHAQADPLGRELATITSIIRTAIRSTGPRSRSSATSSRGSRWSPASRSTRRRTTSSSAACRPRSRASRNGSPRRPTTRSAPPSRRSSTCSAITSRAPRPSSRRRRR